MKRFEISIFRFNPTRDYLPYYKKYSLKCDLSSKLSDLLEDINSIDEFSYEKQENFRVILNNKCLKISTSLSDIYKDFGKDIVIEPISISRAKCDLLIDDSDFYEKLKPFSQYMVEDDILAVDEFKYLNYISNSYKINPNYIGNGILMSVNYLLKRNRINEEDIIALISDRENGALYHTSLENRVYQEDIDYDVFDELIDKVASYNHIKYKKEIDLSKNRIKFEEFTSIEDIKYDFNQFNIAYYSRENRNEDEIKKLNSKFISLSFNRDDLGVKTLKINSEFAYKLSSNLLLEAFDKGADFLVVDDEESFYLLDNHQKQISKIAGRDINLPILHISELELLSKGEIDKAKKSLNRHLVNVSFV